MENDITTSKVFKRINELEKFLYKIDEKKDLKNKNDLYYNLDKKLDKLDKEIVELKKNDEIGYSNIENDVKRLEILIIIFELKFELNEEHLDIIKAREIVDKELSQYVNREEGNPKNLRNKYSLGNYISQRYQNNYYVKDEGTLKNVDHKRIKKKVINNSNEYSFLWLMTQNKLDTTLLDILDNKILDLEERNESLTNLILNRMDDNELFWEMFEFNFEDLEEEYKDNYWEYSEEIRNQCVQPYQTYTMLLAGMNKDEYKNMKKEIEFNVPFYTKEEKKKIADLEKRIKKYELELENNKSNKVVKENTNEEDNDISLN